MVAAPADGHKERRLASPAAGCVCAEASLSLKGNCRLVREKPETTQAGGPRIRRGT